MIVSLPRDSPVLAVSARRRAKSLPDEYMVCRSEARRRMADSPGAQLPDQVIAECDRRVMLGVTGAVHERRRPFARHRKQGLERWSIPPQLGKVATTELGPLPWIVPEPASKLRAGCHVLQPSGERQLGLAYAARPQPLDKKSCAVTCGGWIVRALEPDHATSHAEF